MSIAPLQAEGSRADTETVVSAAGVSTRKYYKETRAAWRRSVRWRFVVAAMLIVAMAIGISLAVPHHHEFMFGWCVGAGTGMLWTMWDSPPAFIENWREGAEGEERTGMALAQLATAGWNIRHDLPDTYGNIDHVGIGPGGVFLLDSKARTGELSLEDGAIVQRRRLSPRTVHRDQTLPRRMRGSALSLRRRLHAATGQDQRVTAVVVIWGTFPQGLVEDDQVTYVAGEKLVGWLAAQPTRLDRRQTSLFTLALDSGFALASTTARCVPSPETAGRSSI